MMSGTTRNDVRRLTESGLVGSAFLFFVAPFGVSGGPAAAQTPGAGIIAPAIVVNQSDLNTGVRYQVLGRGFREDTCGVRIHLDDVQGVVLGFAVPDNGVFEVCVTIPEDTELGEHRLFAQGLLQTSGEFQTCSAPRPQETATFDIIVVEGVRGPFIVGPIAPVVFEGDLRNLPTLPPWQPGDPVREGPGQDEPCGEEDDGPEAASRPSDGDALPLQQPPADPAVFRQFGTPLVSFDGVPAGGVLPPDTIGDVGPDHYIQMVNVAMAVWDKQGNQLAGPFNPSILWQLAGVVGGCAAGNGDPDVKYDRLADRWVVTQFVAFTNQCIAVSRTGDPVTGGWYLYDFPTGGVVNDYPKFGVWPDAYYMGTQRGFPASGSDVWAFDRSQMLFGLSGTVVRFFNTGQFMLPGDLDGPTPPPPGAPNLFARHRDGAVFGGNDRLELWAFSVDFNNPAASTFSLLSTLNTAGFDRNLCGLGLMGQCVPQPGTNVRLETLTPWLMSRLQYRNFGTHASLVVNHTVDVNGADLAGIRWYELRSVAGGPWGISQQGTYSPNSIHRWMGSIAMDGAGNMALGYSVSSDTTFPGIRYAGRLASDPSNTLPQGEGTIQNGNGSQLHNSGRWGDYSSLSVDPVNDCTFWFSSEYYANTGQAGWRTRVASFKFPSCNTAPTAVCQDVTKKADANCCVTVNAADVDGGSTDPDADPLAFCMDRVDGAPLASGNCVPTVQICGDGAHTVRLVVTDPEGLSDTCTAGVNVVDNTDPLITDFVINKIDVDDDCDGSVSFTARVTDNCCLEQSDIGVLIELVGTNAVLSNKKIHIIPAGPNAFIVQGWVTVSDLTSCPAKVKATVFATDCSANRNTTQESKEVDVNDVRRPVATVSAVSGSVDDNCAYLLPFSGTVEDNCCIDPNDITVDVDLLTGNATLGAVNVSKVALGGDFVQIDGTVLVSKLTSCPATVRVTVKGKDCCDNTLVAPAVATADVIDETPPVAICPDDLVLGRGPTVACRLTPRQWLDSFTASDNCDDMPTLANDAEALGAACGGFPCDGTTEVTFTATDDCDNVTSCRASITVVPNHPGWNWVDVRVDLTSNQPTYWSAEGGQPAGVSPLQVLDPGCLPGRKDPEGSGDRVLRGYLVGWAVDESGDEIRWNHLAGNATIVNYDLGTAAAYGAYSFAVVAAVGNGDSTDGTPGQLLLNGMEYEHGFDELVFDFYASGSSPHATSRFSILEDADLTLLPVSMDLQQETAGPVSTKAAFTVWNMNERKFTGMDRCVTCWDQSPLSLYGLPNHFLISNLQTAKGKARVNGVASQRCDRAGLTSQAAALLGVMVRHLSFQPSGPTRLAALNLIGMGEQDGVIRADFFGGPTPELSGGGRNAATAGAIAAVDADARVSHTEKGSLLVFPNIELRWNANGDVLLQDTFVELTNDFRAGVAVQMYFVNGDPTIVP